MSPLAQAALSSWTIDPGLVLGLIVAAVIYLRGWRVLHGIMPNRFPSWRASAFLGGVLTLWLSVASPLDTFSGLLLSAHMVQHLLLWSVVPPLLLLGEPFLPLLRGLPRSFAHDGLGPFLIWPALRHCGHALTHPVVGWLAMSISLCPWHLGYSSAHDHAGRYGVNEVNARAQSNPGPRLSQARRGIRAILVLAMILALILASTRARADGGVVRKRETQGPFIITVFTPSEISVLGSVEVTVMVQRAETEGVILDAEVDLSFAPPAGASLKPNDPLCGPFSETSGSGPSVPGQPAIIRAHLGRSSNKLLHVATVTLRAVGDWEMRASVRQAGDVGAVSCVLPVSASDRRLAGLWPYLALPPFGVGFFALNQYLRRKSK